jgi:hypothetical protein
LCSLPNYAEKSKAWPFKTHKFSANYHKFSNENPQIQPKPTRHGLTVWVFRGMVRR